MLKIIPTNQFKRDVQKIAKDKTKNLDELTLVINMLANGESFINASAEKCAIQIAKEDEEACLS